MKQEKTRYHLTLHSMAHKLTGLTVWRTPSYTCPDTCPLKGTGCYDTEGNCNVHRSRLDRGYYQGVDVKTLIKQLPLTTSIVRPGIGGDLAGKSNMIDKQENTTLFKALFKEHKKVLLFTHKPLTHGGTKAERTANLETIKKIQEVNPTLAVNVSCEKFSQVDKAIKAGLDAVCIVPDNTPVRLTPGGIKVVTCPEAQDKTDGCASCGRGQPLCSRKNRGYAIGFPAHGSRVKKVLALLK